MTNLGQLIAVADPGLLEPPECEVPLANSQ